MCKATILESALKMRGRRAQTANNFYLVKIFPFDVWHVHVFRSYTFFKINIFNVFSVHSAQTHILGFPHEPSFSNETHHILFLFHISPDRYHQTKANSTRIRDKWIRDPFSNNIYQTMSCASTHLNKRHSLITLVTGK